MLKHEGCCFWKHRLQAPQLLFLRSILSSFWQIHRETSCTIPSHYLVLQYTLGSLCIWGIVFQLQMLFHLTMMFICHFIWSVFCLFCCKFFIKLISSCKIIAEKIRLERTQEFSSPTPHAKLGLLQGQMGMPRTLCSRVLKTSKSRDYTASLINDSTFFRWIFFFFF